MNKHYSEYPAAQNRPATILDAPIFRLTYSLLENETINTKFEMSQDGQNFMTYIEGKSKRVK